MIRKYIADLHVHSVLSPCAAVEMTPRNIIRHAAELGIDVIAITDHNACDNVCAALEAARGTGLTVIPGMEVETREEIHLVVLLEDIGRLREWERIVASHRPARLNDEKRFGAQFIVDGFDNLVGIKQEMLLTPLTMGLSDITRKVASLGGLCIASHIDRPSYSLIGQLGFIPDDIVLAAVEVSRNTKPADAVHKIPAIGDLPVITSSDAHTIEQLISGPRTEFHMVEPTLAEIRKALAGIDLRKAVV